MKKYLTLSFFFLSFTAYNQTLVNLQTDSLTYIGPLYQYSKYAITNSGNILVQFDSYNPASNLAFGGYNADMVEISPSLGLLAAYSINSLGVTNTYGTNLFYKDGYTYSVGAVLDSANANAILCYLIKFDSSLDTVWTITQNIDSAATEQIPFAISVDNSGNVYMGAAITTATTNKIEINKYDSLGHRTFMQNMIPQVTTAYR